MSQVPAFEGLHVAILGWAGSTERQLRGVERWYQERGAKTFTTRARVFRNMARPDGWAREGRELAARLRLRARRDEAPILVHLFSNSGFWTFAAALPALPEATLARIRGVILDSAPGVPPHIGARFFADSATRAMMPMALRAFGKPAALSNPWLTPPIWLFMRGWYHLSQPQQREAEASLGTIAEAGAWPMLFLYSDADTLVSAAHVEAQIDRSRAAGRDVEAVRFAGSSHVLHMLKHRRRYFEAVAAFVERTRRSESSPGWSLE